MDPVFPKRNSIMDNLPPSPRHRPQGAAATLGTIPLVPVGSPPLPATSLVSPPLLPNLLAPHPLPPPTTPALEQHGFRARLGLLGHRHSHPPSLQRPLLGR